MADFNFISIPELRKGLESDYRELRACVQAEAWKAVHVLAGSIVEAVLIDALSGAGVAESKLDSMEFAPLIALAKEKGFLSDEAVDLSTVVRKYRNLIHPGRVKRLEKSVDNSEGIVAAELVEIITKQVAKRKRDTYGFTAEQLFERLRGGSSVLPLVAHLISETPKREIERLLIDVLPKALMYIISNADPTADELNHLGACYRSVFDAAGDDVKVTVTKALYKVYRNEPESLVLIYEDHFFTASALTYLSENEGQFIKAHFLARISQKTLPWLHWKLGGIGPFLTAEEAERLSVILLIAVKRVDKDVASSARSRLLAEYPKMTTEARAKVREMADGPEYSDILATLNQLPVG